MTEQLERIGTGNLEHCNEWHIYGPPGTGKTDNTMRQTRRAAERFGRDKILVTSFSKAAAAEVAGRDNPLPPNAIGTLHSHCYHALGRPRIAEAHVKEWNAKYSGLQITPHRSGGKLDGDEGGEAVKGAEGDYWLGELNKARGKRRPKELWPSNLRRFSELWEDYKTSNELLDFTDLIERACHDVKIAPGDPSVIIADEGQDFNALEIWLLSSWGKYAEYFIVALDDDQTIFSHCGASPEALIDRVIPAEHRIILKQSHRVPRAVHAAALRCIEQVSHRIAKEYLPRMDEDGRTVEGLVERLATGHWKSPEHIVLDHAMRQVDDGKTVMFLTSCSYMLAPTLKALREAAIPFENKYRRSNGAWNPIRRDTAGAAANRVLSLLVPHPISGEFRRPWQNAEVAQWAEWLNSKGTMRRGAKKLLESLPIDGIATEESLLELFEPEALDSLFTALEGPHEEMVRWWRERLAPSFAQRAEYVAAIAERRGPEVLAGEPPITVGTIHSVKGAQADVVYLFPDLSPEGWREYERYGPPRDSVLRTIYVGMTRAREALYVCPQASPMAVGIEL